MKTVVIANPQAGGGRIGREWPQWQRNIEASFGPMAVHLTTRRGHAEELATSALRDGAQRIVVVGGDGTLNEVVNGFTVTDNGGLLGREATLAVVAAGTGGDFGRSIGISGLSIAQAYQSATVRSVDLGRAELTRQDGSRVVRHFINEASLGVTGLVMDKVNHTTKRFGAKASFLVGAVRGYLSYENQPVRLTIDESFDEEIVINTVVVANGRYFGGGMMIAPTACVDDGAFEVIVIGDISLAYFLRQTPRLYRGQHIGIPGVQRLAGRNVTVTPLGREPLFIEIDGEQPGCAPVSYSLVPRALKLLAPWSRAEAAAPAA